MDKHERSVEAMFAALKLSGGGKRLPITAKDGCKYELDVSCDSGQPRAVICVVLEGSVFLARTNEIQQFARAFRLKERADRGVLQEDDIRRVVLSCLRRKGP